MTGDKDMTRLERMIEEGPAEDREGWLKEAVKGFQKLEPDDQAELADKLSEKAHSEEINVLMERLHQSDGTALPALVVLGRSLVKQDKADEHTLSEMERWITLCEESDVAETPELFSLPDNIQSAVISHLGRWLRADLLSALSDAAPDKRKSKMIKKALHQARSAGAVLDGSAGVASVAEGAPELSEKKDEAYITPPDSSGSFIVYFYRTVFDKDNLFSIIVDDEQGVLNFERFEVPEHKWRQIIESTRRNPMVVLSRCDPDYARYLVKKYESEGEKRGHHQDSDFLRHRRVLGIADQDEVPNPLLQEFSSDELRRETGLAARSHELLESRVFDRWSFLPEDEGKIMLELKNIDESPLDLTDAQKEARKQELFEEEASWLLSLQGRPLWRDRMLVCAYILYLLEQPEDARMAAATAFVLEDSEKPVPSFFTELLRECLEERMEDEQEPSGPDMSRGGIVKV
ncbi:MAG: hypothetical protein R6V10_00290 [bacterium]